MRITCTLPHPRLAPYISQIWNFESSEGVASADARLIVPDGKVRIIVPYKSATQAMVEGRVMYAQKHQILLAGIQTKAITIGSTNADVGTVGIELTAKGAYRLFGLNMRGLVDQLVTFEDIFGAMGARLRRRVEEAENPVEKISILQHFLLQLLDRNTAYISCLDYAIDEISNSYGTIRIRTLQESVGCSRRYLDMLFKEHVGLSPKTYARILRFQAMHRLLMQDALPIDRILHDYYFDQSHFIKDFKCFTGSTPAQYRHLVNNFGKAFSAEV